MNTVAASAQVLANIILPVQGDNILLPSALIAEVVLVGQLSSAISSPILLGHLLWREQDIPVVCFEGLRDGALPQNVEIRQIAVFHGLSEKQKLPYFAMVLSAAPHLSRLASTDLEAVYGPQNPLVHSRVRAAGQNLLIPNWDYLEQQILSALQLP
jgi:chemosensory pili system protein ChpC